MSVVVGIGGKYCAGKGQVAAYLQQRGFKIIDVDAVGHEVLIQKKIAVVKQFGADILSADGVIDRKKLGKRVFAHKKQRMLLESIMHPAMRQRVQQSIAENRHAYIGIDSALLFSMQLDSLCDAVLWIEAPRYKRIIRALHRDALSLLQVFARVNSQRHLRIKVIESHADIYIVNNRFSHRTLVESLQPILNAIIVE